ncbi:hypothetical protein QBC43DRAFT_312553 [Cladorrhinum sp. PSN259]|nr:hypothetical protein QBC43DRAFT_312553 [Cladorrhinum sp. PSN259]
MKQKKILREAKKAAKRQAREAANRETVQPTGPREIVLFSAVELLEQILLELDMATLLTVAQRVHSHWRKVINTSSAIQQHLFFRPISVPTSSCPSPVQNPLLESHFWPFFRTWAPKPRTAIWQHRDRILPLSFRPTGELSAEILWRALPNFSDMSNSKRRQVALTRADASWRRMLVSQPPPRRIGRMKEWGRLVSTGTQRQRLETVWDRKFVDVPDGLKMGELYDIIDAAIWRRFRRGGKARD